jgi:hypothetical protein
VSAAERITGDVAPQSFTDAFDPARARVRLWKKRMKECRPSCFLHE